MKESRSTSTHLHRWRARTLLCAVTLLVSGCGLNGRLSTSSTQITTDCVLPPDQGGTLSGRWMKTAVPIAFQQGAWNSTEIAAMIAAAKYWNTFFAASMGYPAIDYGSDASPRLSGLAHPTDADSFCQESPIIDSSFNFIPSGTTVIYKDGSWPYTSGIIALTTTCRPGKASGHQLFYFSNAYMEVNYQYFFVSGQRVPDLQSIVLHEMGHLMGINHTCEVNSTLSGVPDCNEEDLPALYSSASMFPTFSFYSNGQGVPRQSLNANDEGRMNCVYKYF